MTEVDDQAGDGEIAECHVCNQRFDTQAELLAHLDEAHPGDLLTK